MEILRRDSQQSLDLSKDSAYKNEEIVHVAKKRKLDQHRFSIAMMFPKETTSSASATSPQKEDTPPETKSAFKKVEKPQTFVGKSDDHHEHLSNGMMQPPQQKHSPSRREISESLVLHNNNIDASGFVSSSLQHMNLPFLCAPNQLIIHGGLNERAKSSTDNSLELFKQRNQISLSSIASLGAGMENNPYLNSKMGISSLGIPVMVPFAKSCNPMVEKMLIGTNPNMMNPPLSSVSLNQIQNWCAMCNTTFRMTSDLVYHMRSHHKREFDHTKKRREEKLRCNVCGETFKERHHLTRHMTSHMGN